MEKSYKGKVERKKKLIDKLFLFVASNSFYLF